jgi:hypothetical protein
LKSEKKKIIDEVNNELISAADNISNPYRKGIDDIVEGDYLDIPLEYMQSSPGPLIHELKRLVVRNKRVRRMEMRELEEINQEDRFLPNKWMYHDEWDLVEVLNYIRQYNDRLRQEDELEDSVDFR